MTQTPPLEEGEQILHHHRPSLRRFRRSAVLMLLLTLPAVAAMLIAFPETIWPVVPLFVTSVLLAQERVTLGRHAAWITNRRVILQGNRSFPLAEVTAATPRRNGVQLVGVGTGKGVKLFYPEDASALAGIVNDARKDIS